MFSEINYTTTHFEVVGSRRKCSNPSDGNIAIEGDDMYLYYGSEWHKFDSSSEYYNTKADVKTHPRICSRCGAPLTSCKCDYCGTMYV